LAGVISAFLRAEITRSACEQDYLVEELRPFPASSNYRFVAPAYASCDDTSSRPPKFLGRRSTGSGSASDDANGASCSASRTAPSAFRQPDAVLTARDINYRDGQITVPLRSLADLPLIASRD